MNLDKLPILLAAFHARLGLLLPVAFSLAAMSIEPTSTRPTSPE